VKAVFGVPDKSMRRATLGLQIPVIAEPYGAQEYPGRITAIAPSADPSSRVFDVELTIANSQSLLKPGMVVTAAVPEEDSGGPPPGAPLVPLTSIVQVGTSREDFAVYVIEAQGGKTIARARRVKVGEVSGNLIAIRDGIALGTRVVVTGATLLVDGEEVRIIP
jgi:multidrug efflux system membrane fusion protein